MRRFSRSIGSHCEIKRNLYDVRTFRVKPIFALREPPGLANLAQKPCSAAANKKSLFGRPSTFESGQIHSFLAEYTRGQIHSFQIKQIQNKKRQSRANFFRKLMEQ